MTEVNHLAMAFVSPYIPWLLFGWLAFETIWDMSDKNIPVWFSLAMLIPGGIMLAVLGFPMGNPTDRCFVRLDRGISSPSGPGHDRYLRSARATQLFCAIDTISCCGVGDSCFNVDARHDWRRRHPGGLGSVALFPFLVDDPIYKYDVQVVFIDSYS